MNSQRALVVTSIAPPNRILRTIAQGALSSDIPFIVIGDVPSPSDFHLEGCDFYSLSRQRNLDFETSSITPERHYARKNIGYLLAIQNGARIIIETDDDNLPQDGFWSERRRDQNVPMVTGSGWVNAYGFFSDERIWPRGLPLDAIQNHLPSLDPAAVEPVDCPIQQGLADGNPDVDAIFRLILPLPVHFRRDRRVALGEGSWCPFNSQNTTWWEDSFPLLYLPAFCSFRMTDIWRSFVAQRIAWANRWSVLFHEPTVWQERNDHNLMSDFADEVPGYLNNRKIADVLENLTIAPGTEYIPDNLRVCYEALVKIGVIGGQEIPLLNAWLNDLAHLEQAPARRASA
jgi:hypothetical protein